MTARIGIARVAADSLQRAAELEAIHARHGEIGEHRVGTELARLLERLMAVVCINGAEAVVLEVFAVQRRVLRSSSTISTSGSSVGVARGLGLASRHPLTRNVVRLDRATTKTNRKLMR